MSTGSGKSIGELREALTRFTDLGGFLGQNMHESKEVLLRVGENTFQIRDVAATFYNGSFVILLEAAT